MNISFELDGGRDRNWLFVCELKKTIREWFDDDSVADSHYLER
jgi:hypothetical protein